MPPPGTDPTRDLRTNRELALAYLAPYLAYVGASGLQASLGRTPAYLLAGLAAGALWLWFRTLQRPLRGPRSPALSVVVGSAVGLLGTALWVALLAPFVAPSTGSGDADRWPLAARIVRMASATLVVPLVEEPLMRSFVLGLALQWQRTRAEGWLARLDHVLDRQSIRELEPGACSLGAALVSSCVFALGHAPHEWAAALGYGGLMCTLYVGRRDLLSCIIAHAVSNAALALWVLHSGRFEFW